MAEGELLQDVLDDLGFGGSSLRVTTESQADQVAYRNEAELIGEAWKTDGVDFVFELQGGMIQLADGWRAGPKLSQQARWQPDAVGEAVATLLSQATPAQPVYGT